MLLALDAGNSTITAGCIENGEIRARATFSTTRRTAPAGSPSVHR